MGPNERQLDHLLRTVSGNKTQAEFIAGFYDGVADEDLAEYEPRQLVAVAESFRAFARDRDPDAAKIRVYNPDAKRHGWQSSHTVVEVVHTDMPFLVDSLTMALNRRGYTIHLTVHPIFRVERTAGGRLKSVLASAGRERDSGLYESWQHVQIDRETDTERLEQLASDIDAVLSDVRVAVADWKEMCSRVQRIRAELEDNPPPSGSDGIGEIVNFLDWMEENRFTFLGYREYDLVREEESYVLYSREGTGLGVLRDERTGRSRRVLPPDSVEHALSPEPLIITKANTIATVHRSTYLDYVGVKRYDRTGEVIGERRFLGLFTSSAYHRSPSEIPILRKKVNEVLRRTGLPSDSHSGKALVKVLETHPRDELFQSSVEELMSIARGIVQLQERQRVKLFLRRDAFGRFYSCLVYAPRDRYNTSVRQKIERILLEDLDGVHTESSVLLGESILARVHIIVRTESGTRSNVETGTIERRIVETVRSWDDRLLDALIHQYGEERARILHRRYASSFSAAYREDVPPGNAVSDIARIHELEGGAAITMSLRSPSGETAGRFRFKIFRRNAHIAISDIVPVLENMGVRVIAERPYELIFADGTTVWIQDVDMLQTAGEVHPLASISELFREAFAAVWAGDVENDSLNRLILGAGLRHDRVLILRAYCRYLLQTGLPFSQRYMEDALAANGAIAALLVRMFETRFDPDLRRNRDRATASIVASIRSALEHISSLDTDRILRAFSSAIRATFRTNYYRQRDGKAVSLKLDSRRLPDLPEPKPVYEIFVYSPKVEAIHLRGGKVARGGLRWSDRREDFRTEVLGLMKAQQVKNTLIVPVGAKGGFVVKQTLDGDREERLSVVRACYAEFLRSMLDITDNIVDGETVPPERCVRHDDNDPYLVVAADKGTATFSDLANSVAAEYSFWLGDAFASGGTVGYDHKKMGITARGAWESVARHFRELGVDWRNGDFTAVGIGDMAGDVFGNGMLYSRRTRLIAAFNHLHIFVDPNPDAETSYAERERLFGLPGSTWRDYDSRLISAGGGVFDRSAKSVKLSRKAAAALGTRAGEVTPNELIGAILKAPVDLLWNGGIGTYVKASREHNRAAGDRVNDPVRVNASELRCRVVGEGGNLGLTQAARIEYARGGGRINTDFIDNSGGVDCSDREVNIKIALRALERTGEVTGRQRDRLFLGMTDEVARQVLYDNYLQAQAISFAEAQGTARFNEYSELIRTLERHAGLSRRLESLPDDDELRERKKNSGALTRPELAVLFAHAKNDLYEALLSSDIPGDGYLSRELALYFPAPIRDAYPGALERHRLRDEIICTAITNSMINRMGPSFPQRMRGDTGVGHAEVARAYTIAREVFDARTIWRAVEAQDYRIAPDIQLEMLRHIETLTRNATRWFLNRPHRISDISSQVAAFSAGVGYLRERLEVLLSGPEAERFENERSRLLSASVPEELAHSVALSSFLYSGLDLVEIADGVPDSYPVEVAAEIYFGLAGAIPLDWLRDRIEALPAEGHWQSVARGSLRENYFGYRRLLTKAVLRNRGDGIEDGRARLDAWMEANGAHLQRTLEIYRDMQSGGPVDFATLSVALQELRRLANRTTLNS